MGRRLGAAEVHSRTQPAPSPRPVNRSSTHLQPYAGLRQAYGVLEGFSRPAPEQADLVVATAW
ncbi:hypothetical protein [Kribbella sp. DT2]|uniref:hypothetical protein n=1 Tax=Kribbella sp. DT2 TaxID=3393427 RepID=UPI003CF80D3B